jgi:16S rRNA (guanine(966)-N(2))-methyltransferase RsmD
MKHNRTDLKVRTLKKEPLRPTTGKVREALFNILHDRIEGVCFLDLYAGTGAIGLEALRRGASKTVFVEASRGCSRNIHEAAERHGLSDKTQVIVEKVSSFIRQVNTNRMSFDIIFLDPPYHTDEIVHIMSLIGKSDLLKQEGIVIAEHFKKRKLPERFGILHKSRDYTYGDSVLSLYHIP